jgi:hypothetical protein
MLSLVQSRLKEEGDMSYVSFHSGPKSVEIKGTEYHWAWELVNRLYKAVREVSGIDNEGDVHATLNTIIVMGSWPLQFLTCFAGLADPILWVRGRDRSWLADIIEEGLRIGILRTGMEDGKDVSLGWFELIDLLRETADLPVATTYSGNFGAGTALIKVGDSRLVTDFLNSLEEGRRIGPDNLGKPRFEGFKHGFKNT